MRSIHLINSAFLSLKIIVDTLTDVGNAKYQNMHHFLKSVNKDITLLSAGCECSTRFQGTAASNMESIC